MILQRYLLMWMFSLMLTVFYPVSLFATPVFFPKLARTSNRAGWQEQLNTPYPIAFVQVEVQREMVRLGYTLKHQINVDDKGWMRLLLWEKEGKKILISLYRTKLNHCLLSVGNLNKVCYVI